MKTADKPKHKETGAQFAWTGALAAALGHGLPALTEVAQDAEDAFEAGGWAGVAVLIAGLAYRWGCKWLDGRGVDVADIDRDARKLKLIISDLGDTWAKSEALRLRSAIALDEHDRQRQPPVEQNIPRTLTPAQARARDQVAAATARANLSPMPEDDERVGP